MNILRKKFVIIIIPAFLAIYWLSSHSSAFAQPKIVFEDEVHDFGEVMQGETVEHTFEFRNEGSEELVIDKVTPS